MKHSKVCLEVSSRGGQSTFLTGHVSTSRLLDLSVVKLAIFQELVHFQVFKVPLIPSQDGKVTSFL